MTNEKVETADINKALLAMYREPEWYLGFEVGNSCGCECMRHADAVAMNAYPSRGFEVRGFEVHICPNCLMWSDDLRAVTAREIFNSFKRLQDKECVSISSE